MKADYYKDKKGRVYLKFTIDTKGRPTDIKVNKSPNEDYSKEAIRLIALMPNWIPATKNGKLIEEEWTLSIIFDDDRKPKDCP